MAVSALSAEAAGQAFGPALNGTPAREKEGWLVSQTHSQAQMEGVGGLWPQPGSLPQAGCEQVQAEGPRWRDSAG